MEDRIVDAAVDLYLEDPEAQTSDYEEARAQALLWIRVLQEARVIRLIEGDRV